MIIVTGSLGLICFTACKFFLKKGFKVIGIDNIDDYYDTKIKYQRLKILNKFEKFKFHKTNIQDHKKLDIIFKKNKINCVIHLAAQAGVRYSIKNPKKYLDSNINGFFNILELSKKYKIKKLIFASSSSVYGENTKFPLKENNQINPKNFYGLTKKNNEEMAKIYSNLYNMNICGLRFFTVYGEWGRPDMFMMKYLHSKKSFDLYNKGEHYRDFTYIKDVIEIILKIIKSSQKGFQLFNICSNDPIKITKVIKIINKHINKSKLRINRLGLQKADVIKTHGDNSKLIKEIKFKKFTALNIGLKNLIEWYKNTKI